MKAYAYGLLGGMVCVVLLPVSGAVATNPSPSPSNEPPWISVPLTGGGGLTPVPGPSLTLPAPSDLPTDVPSVGEGVLPSMPDELPAEEAAKPSPSPTVQETARPGSGETSSGAPVAPPERSWEPSGKGHVAPGDYDLFVDPEDEGAAGSTGTEGGGDGMSFGAGGPLLPVLPLGAGIASLGLGLGALALRMRRRG